MQVWVIYALLAAIFISIRDIISLDFIKRYDYIQYMVLANIIIFIGTMIYVHATDFKIKKPNMNDLFIILVRLAIVYFIIDPSVYNSIKNCDNPGYAKSIISLNTLFIFFLATIVYKSEINSSKIAGVILMLAGSYFIVG